MKATPYLEQVFHLTIQLLNNQGHEDIAQQLNEIYQLPEWIQVNNPLLKKGLTKIIKEYVKNNEKMLRYYQNRGENQPNQEETKKSRKRSVDSHRKSMSPKVEAKTRNHVKKAESPVVSKVASPKATTNTAKGWLSKFEKPKTLEELNQVVDKIPEEAKVEVAENPTKHSKKQKKVKIESSQYQSEQDDFQLEPKKKLKKEVKQEKKVEKKKKKHVKQSSESEEEEMQEEKVSPPKKQAKPAVIKNNQAVQQKKQQQYNAESNDGYPKKFFSRINVEEVGPIREQLRDNSFQAKAKFGQQADHWGQFGYEKLRDTRGDSFKKTKGKLKNRDFQGALMDINKINSIPIA